MLFSNKQKTAEEIEAERIEEERIAKEKAERDAVLFAIVDGDSATVATALETRAPDADLLCAAAFADKPDMIRLIAGNEQYANMLATDVRSVALAARMGHEESLKSLLAIPACAPSADGNLAIEMACEAGKLNTIEILLSAQKFDPNPPPNPSASFGHWNGLQRGLVAACLYGHIDVVKRLADVADAGAAALAADDQLAFRCAAEAGRLPIVQWFLSERRVDLRAPCDGSTVGNVAFCSACMYGYLEVMDALLAEPAVDIAAKSQRALRHACARGPATAVKRLLQDPRVKPSALKNAALAKAMEHERNEIIDLLMGHERFDPNKGINPVIELGIRNVDVLQRVLSHPKLNNRALWWRYAVRTSSIYYSADTMEALLADPTISDADKAVARLQIACNKQDVAAVTSLLQGGSAAAAAEHAGDTNDNPSAAPAAEAASEGDNGGQAPHVTFDPGCDGQAALVLASAEGCVPIINALLAHPKVYPTVEAFVRCVGCGGRNLEAIKVLMADPRLDPSGYGNAAWRYVRNTWACEEVRALLMSDPRVAAVHAQQSADIASGKHSKEEQRPDGSGFFAGVDPRARAEQEGWDAIDALWDRPAGQPERPYEWRVEVEAARLMREAAGAGAAAGDDDDGDDAADEREAYDDS